MKSANKYILYARKSTDSEDKQIQSLDDQIKSMKLVAKTEGLKIVDTIKESKSAKSPYQRQKFDGMIEKIKNGEANAILCYQIDRLSRNPTENGLLQQLLQDGIIKHIKAIDRSYKSDDNSMQFSIDSTMSNEYVRELIRKVTRGSYSKADKGWLPGKPAIGYLNGRVRGQEIKKVIIADPERFAVVRKLWDMALTGTYTVAQITRIADRELGLRQPLREKIGGNPLSYSAAYAMFRNPFYMGKVRYGGQLIDGKHTPMVTEEEFNKVQSIFNTGYTTRPKDKEYTFIFRGMLRCGDCGFAVTTQRKVKQLKDGSESVNIYCHCTGRRKGYACSQKSIYTREDNFVEQVKDRLSRFTIDPDFYQLAIEALAEENDDVIAQQEAVSSNQDKSIERKKKEIQGLQRMRYRGECPDDDFYDSEMKHLEADLKGLLKARTKSEVASRDWRKLANETFTFARYAKDDFESDDLEKQQVVMKKLSQNLTVLDGKIQFTPVKYLIPIEEAYPELTAQLKAVRTMSQQRKKAALDDLSSKWYTRQDLNLWPLAPQANALSS
jgi:site-specific DNA recombinase